MRKRTFLLSNLCWKASLSHRKFHVKMIKNKSLCYKNGRSHPAHCHWRSGCVFNRRPTEISVEEKFSEEDQFCHRIYRKHRDPFIRYTNHDNNC
ncbi:hypothetical protein MT325_m271L [Paramecium bursaria chlorella virus MT325]|uniref:Uncharacterized protein m271L n=1 Tax=Paramecium bursaria Chlorella virus MT325 TaxID=346932 RepID=A7IU01_PBCVM|nr:hypothetical protein MT325_m271L [Paramecium bursaria chlorella virus MT325]